MRRLGKGLRLLRGWCKFDFVICACLVLYVVANRLTLYFRGLVYLILIIISICQTYRQVRRAQHTYTANLRLQELQASDTRRQCSDNGRSDAAAIPLPDSPLQPHSGEAGHISQRRSSTESATRENDILDEDVEDLGEPIRPRDMV